jgi:hypothetical protein
MDVLVFQKGPDQIGVAAQVRQNAKLDLRVVC